jgi:hypothetical protein
MRPLNQPPTPESPFRWIKRSIHRSAAAVVVALIVVGCGGGSGAPGTVTPTQPGATPAGVATADDLYAYCTYPAADGRDKAMIFVTRSSTAAAYFQTVKVNTGHAVSGVGDEAYWGTGSFLPGLYFLKGGVMAYVSSDSSSSQGPSEASLTELGKLLASRM